MPTILDGKKVRDFLAENIKTELLKLDSKPKLVILQVGNDERSSVYVRQKKIFGEKLGFDVEYIQLDKKTEQADLILTINQLNADKSVNGIIIQLPLIGKIEAVKVVESITPEKDVDGLNSQNLRNLLENRTGGFMPATTKGIISLLDYYKFSIEGKKVVIVGRSSLVGRPTALALLNRNATVTVCHTKTKKIQEETKRADIIIVAAGSPKLIKKSFVKAGQIVIDVGITKVGDKLLGDVDFEPVSKVVKAITPVPGGVGPMTVVSLFENLLTAYKNQKG